MEDDNLANFADSDDELDDVSGREQFKDAVLYGTDWTVRSILQQIENGNIDLSPSFQRRDAWGSANKSRFIESVILQLPIPQIVLAERKEQRGTYIVLDGKQRLLTLTQFAGELPEDHALLVESQRSSPLRLQGLKLLTELNGSTYVELVEQPLLKQMRTQFDNHTIRSALIRNWPNEDYLYEVFIRLNTGSARLSPQELRQAMKPGPFTEFLNRRSASSAQFQAILGLSAPDFRMRDVDLLLRTIAFMRGMRTYTGNLKPYLDGVHATLNSTWSNASAETIDLVSRIEGGLQFLIDCFRNPKFVGRRWSGSFDGPVNRAVLDIQLASAMDQRVRDAEASGKLNFVEEFIRFSNTNPDFVRAISGTTKSITAIKTRFGVWQSHLEGKLGAKLSFPEMPHG